MKTETIDKQIAHSLKAQLINLKPILRYGYLNVRFIGTKQGISIYTSADNRYRYFYDRINDTLRTLPKNI